jgi:hypothetical protein
MAEVASALKASYQSTNTLKYIRERELYLDYKTLGRFYHESDLHRLLELVCLKLLECDMRLQKDAARRDFTAKPKMHMTNGTSQ